MMSRMSMGKRLVLASGAASDSPLRTFSAAASTASARTWLSAESLAICRACRIGTPLAIRVPRMRQNRQTATMVKSLPRMGMLELPDVPVVAALAWS